MPENSVVSNVVVALLNLLVLDVILLCAMLVVIAALASRKRAAYAVMKRNFLAYFTNPTGYVFLCIFVFLTSVAAFWPYQFFNQNLATLDQLNYWYPLIMLVFVPAITMSIWAEEKRQGTDELLLTLPADDFDIVIGKYMSAAAIFTFSLLFSQLSTFVTLSILTEGILDVGLFFTTYLGYWFVGLTMIAIGMIASFLTGNLTVGFIMGALFNAPLAFATLADSISPSQAVADFFTQCGIARPFDDFGRGLISMSSVGYFLLVATVALYMCMVLIGRRHWTGGKDGNTMAWHYLARVLGLILFTSGAVMLFRSKDVLRYDATEGKVSSLAPATKSLLSNLNPDRPIVIDAYVSTDIPEKYARTRYELINLLKEFRTEASATNRNIEVNVYDNIELFSEEARQASDRFGIKPVSRMVREKGVSQTKQFIIGAAFRSGLEKVTVPVFEYGIPVEYELVRSINTVSRGERKRIGLVYTQAKLTGGTSIQGIEVVNIPRHPIVDELEKQYDVEDVDLSSPVTRDMFDALVAVQPSSLPPENFKRLIDAVKSGMPTAIFEDTAPVFRSDMPATGQPRLTPGVPQMGGARPIPKGDIRDLWQALEITSPGNAMPNGLYFPDLIVQQYIPYPSMPTDYFHIYIDQGAPGTETDALNPDNPITAGLNQVLCLYSSAIEPIEKPTLKHTPLLRTGRAGRLNNLQLQRVQRGQAELTTAVQNTKSGFALAMAVESQDDAVEKESDDPTDESGIKAVYVADTDLMSPTFLMIRAQPDQVDDTHVQFQNVTFLLNIFDWLTGETEFIDVRNHRPMFTSLRMIDAVKAEETALVRNKTQEFQDKYNEVKRDAEEDMTKNLQKSRERIEDLQEKSADGKVPQELLNAAIMEYKTKEERLNRGLRLKKETAERERENNIREIERKANQQVTKIQNRVKAAAVALPCIPPLAVGIIVFASRRLRERENITKARLK